MPVTIRRYVDMKKNAKRDGEDPPLKRKVKPKHRCPDWDMLEIHPGDPEMDCCSCDYSEDGYVRWLR